MKEMYARMPLEETIHFNVSDVTGTRSVEAKDIQASLPADTVAKYLAKEKLQLPQNVAWALRRDDSIEPLDGKTPIGKQIKPGDETTLIPKTHLGQK